MRKLIVISLLLFIFTNCANRMIILEPDVFETGNTQPAGRIEAAFSGLVSVPFYPSAGLMVGYSFLDNLSLKLRGSGTLIPGGTFARCQMTGIFKFLDYRFLKTSISAGPTYSWSKFTSINVFTHVTNESRYSDYSAKAALNLGIHPFGGIFAIYGNMGVENQWGDFPQKGGPTFERLYYIAGGGLAWEGDKLSVKLGTSIPLNNTPENQKIDANHSLDYLPSIGLEMSYSFDPKMGFYK